MRLADKNKKLMTYRANNNGAVLTKGKRTLYLLFKSVNESKKAKEAVAKHSFNKLFTRGRKVRVLGSNVAYISFKKK